MTIERKQAGDPLVFPADAYNAFADTAEAHQQGTLDAENLPAAEPPQQQSGVIWVKNGTGNDRGRFDVVGLSTPIVQPSENLDEFKRQVTFAGVSPALPTHLHQFAVLQDAVPDGEIGRAVVSGVTAVQVDVQHEGDTTAGVADGTFASLKSGLPGAAILWKESGTGTKWAIVRLGAARRVTFPAKITGNASLGTNRWKYAWTEQEYVGDSVQNKPNGRSGTTGGDYAVNRLEMFHTSTYAWGVHTGGNDYPSGAAPRPVGGGGGDNTHKYDVVVEMEQVIDANGNTRYYFSATGSHDGTCD